MERSRGGSRTAGSVPFTTGCFLVGPLMAQNTREMAAALACGPTAVVSHHAAAALWGLRPPCTGPIDVTVTRQVRARQGIRIHRARALDARDVTRRAGIPLTTPARTLLDLAATLDARTLARAIEEAEIQRLATRRDLAALQARSAGRRGARALAEALSNAQEPAMTRSEAEAELLRLIRAARLPHPETNVRIAGYEVDFLWRAQRLVVEVDGFAYHGTREAFERDRRKDADLQAHGLRTIRATFRQITEQPLALIANLATSIQAPFNAVTAI